MISNCKKIYFVNNKWQKIVIVISIIIIVLGIWRGVKNIIIGNIEAFFMNMVLLLLGFWEIYINIYEIKQQNKIILILGGKPYD